MGLLIESTLPGITVLVNQSQVARPIQRQPTSTAFAVGYSPWGPVGVPTVVTSWEDYRRRFGGLDVNSYLGDFCYAFFNLFPGKQVVISRVVGPAATRASLVVKDRTNADGLRIQALYPSSRVDIRARIETGSTTDTVRITLRSNALNRTETYDNVVMNAAEIVRLNQRSQLVQFTLLSTQSHPQNLPALTDAQLTGGNDDFGGLTDGSFIGTDDGITRTGLQAFNDELFGAGQVAVPGVGSSAVHAALIAHAERYHRLALLDPPLGSDKDDVLTIRRQFGTWYGALYWPWVQAADFAGSGLLRLYPPSCFAAGACALVDRTRGTHKAPANITIPIALDVERAPSGGPQTDENTHELLNAHDINVIKPVPEQGVKIYGARVMTADRRVQMVHEIRLLNLFYYSAKLGYAWAPFSTIDGTGRLFRDLRRTGINFLRPFWEQGALYGRTPEEAFIVVADESNNPPEELEQQRVHVQWGVKISPTAEQIIIAIDNVPIAQDLSVLQ